MSDFKKAYKKVIGYEGGYVNDPIDPGRETYKGISRKYNPNWSGWKLIDFYKDNDNFLKQLNSDAILQEEVKSMYKKKYWDIFYGDRISNQRLCNKLFDISVNLGPRRAVKFLQIGLNALNRNESLYKSIEETGVMGDNTHTLIEYLLNKDSEVHILKILNILQGSHYMKRISDKSNQKRFIRGWLNRVNL